MSWLTVTETRVYKGRKIETTETPLQRFFVVDGDLSAALWSLADARRAINGQQTVSLPVDIRHHAL